ncbi:MAG: hypothetical protein LBJ00_12525, partial [Planctomycetaceae bacterium]|nr:hypothetical protein [Planctomycetaceae bacterium]
YIKLEKLKFAHKLNHFALKAKIYLAASKAAWNEMCKIKHKVDAQHEIIKQISIKRNTILQKF